MNLTIFIVKSEIALDYRDDIIIISKPRYKHTKNVQKNPSLLHAASAARQVKNGTFSPEIVASLGHAICWRQLELPSHTRRAMGKRKIPTRITKFWPLLSLYNVFREIIPNSTEIVASRNQRLKNGQMADSA